MANVSFAVFVLKERSDCWLLFISEMATVPPFENLTYFIPQSHDDRFICKGKCLLADKCFIERTQAYVNDLGKRFCDELSLPKDTITNRVYGPHDENEVRLCDEILGVQCSFTFTDETSKEMGVKLLINLVEIDKAKSQIGSGFNEFTWILSWLATYACDSEKLEEALRDQNNEHLPKCYLQSLLLNCVRHHFVEGVSFMLDFGANPNWFHWKGGIFCHLPITYAIEELGKLYIDEEAVDKLDEIVQVLVKRTNKNTGQSPFHKTEPSEFSNYGALSFLESVAEVSEKTSKIMIDHGFNRNGNGPLVLQAFHDVINTVDNSESFTTTFHLAKRLLLRLLKGGSRYTLADLSLFRLVNDEEIVTSYDIEVISFIVWGRYYVFLEMLAEFSTYQGGKVAPYVSTVSKLNFPMSLMKTCRRSILQTLPFGEERRNAAIDALQLPDLLTKYLKFSEFEPIVDEETIEDLEELFNSK